MRMKDKGAIVTGGASGMGAADVRVFAREGATVVIADILEDEARQLVETLTADGATVVFERLDVTDPDQWERATAATVARFGGLDVLVNNAGLTGAGIDDVTDVSCFDRIVAVNLR